jgi:hypothetical protein
MLSQALQLCGHSLTLPRQVLEATNTIRDALVVQTEPVYGLTTMHATLRSFKTEPKPVFADPETKLNTYAFGLMIIGKFIMRLPYEVLEEELPRLKATLTGVSTVSTRRPAYYIVSHPEN